jgi:hypothetical protein
MQSQKRERPAGREPIFDAAFRVMAFLVILVAAFSVLIMGIFATNSETPTAMTIGMSIILGGPAVLLLMILARLASRPFVTGGGKRQAHMATFVTTMVYCVGAPALAFGTWQCVRLWMQAPNYQEASIEVPNAIPQF